MEGLNITRYFQDNDEIYIRNRTNPMGIISMLFGEEYQHSYSLPKSTKPVRLTDEIPKELIVKAMDFRRLVNKGAVELLTAEEFDKITQGQEHLTAHDEVRELIDKPLLDVSSSDSASTEGPEDVNPRIIQLMHVHNASAEDKAESGGVDLSDDAILGEVQNIELTSTDLAFILTQSHGSINDWVKEEITDSEVRKNQEATMQPETKAPIQTKPSQQGKPNQQNNKNKQYRR